MSGIEHIINEVERGAIFDITRGGKLVATVLPTEEYESLVETLDILSDPETMAAIKGAEEERR